VAGGGIEVELRRTSGQPIRDDEELTVAALDTLVQRGVLGSAVNGAAIDVPADAPGLRELSKIGSVAAADISPPRISGRPAMGVRRAESSGFGATQ